MRAKEKEHVIKLRKEGKTYREILKEVAVSKGVLSLWLRNLNLSEDSLLLIKDSKERAREKGAITFKKNWLDKYKKIYDSYEPPFKDPFFMLGLGIYMGEGSKFSRSMTGVSNSDFKILNICIKWLKKYFLESSMDFGVSIHNHDKEKNQEDIQWWSSLLKIPVENFKTPNSAISISSLKKRNTLEHGTCYVYVRGKNNWVIAEKIRKSMKLVSLYLI